MDMVKLTHMRQQKQWDIVKVTSTAIVIAMVLMPHYLKQILVEAPLTTLVKVTILAMEILIVIAIVMEQMLLPSRKILDEANLEIPALHV